MSQTPPHGKISFANTKTTVKKATGKRKQNQKKGTQILSACMWAEEQQKL